MPRKKRIKLSNKAFRVLSDKVKERDGWKCRNPECKSRENLTVHHIIYRSALGGDVETNLITSCLECHEKFHSKSIILLSKDGSTEGLDGSEKIQFLYSNGKVKLG